MQEEIEQKSATLMINGTKFSLRTLKSAALKLLAHRQNPSAPGVKHRGKQTVQAAGRAESGRKQYRAVRAGLEGVPADHPQIRRRLCNPQSGRRQAARSGVLQGPRFGRFNRCAQGAGQHKSPNAVRTSFRSPTAGKSEGTGGKDHRENPKQGAEPMSKRKKHTLTLSEAAKKKLVLNLPYCMIGLYATKLGQRGAWRKAQIFPKSCCTWAMALPPLLLRRCRVSILSICSSVCLLDCCSGLPCISKAKTRRSSAKDVSMARRAGERAKTSSRLSTPFSKTTSC